MRLAFASLEDVYLRGRTVHFVGNGHRFYGNIECESSTALEVSQLEMAKQGILAGEPDWVLQLDLTLDQDMGRNGSERIFLHFAQHEQAQQVREAFTEVARAMEEAKGKK